MAWAIAVGVSVLWLVFAFLPRIASATGHDWNLEQFAQWGESFGPLATLFAAAGFAALLWQIRDGQQTQHKLVFDTNYFELLKLLRDAKKEVRFSHGPEYTSASVAAIEGKEGLSSFRDAWHEARFHIRKQKAQSDPAAIKVIYEKFVHEPYESNFGPYFRMIYTILRRVKDDAVLSEKEKATYGNLLRSQINSYELAILALNGLAGFSKDFSQLIEYFHLLKYMPEGERKKILSSCYTLRAFAARD